MSESDCSTGTCGLDAGVGIALNIAKMAEAKTEDIQEDLFGGKITVHEAMDKIKKRLPDKFHRDLVEEVENLMKEQIKPCVSLIVKTEMTKQIDDWIENRELPEEVVENLKRSKEAIDNIQTCEAE